MVDPTAAQGYKPPRSYARLISAVKREVIA